MFAMLSYTPDKMRPQYHAVEMRPTATDGLPPCPPAGVERTAGILPGRSE